MYCVIPLIYAANEQFKNTIRFALEFYEEIDPEALQYAVKQVKKRYPYFSVKIEMISFRKAYNPVTPAFLPVCSGVAPERYN